MRSDVRKSHEMDSEYGSVKTFKGDHRFKMIRNITVNKSISLYRYFRQYTFTVLVKSHTCFARTQAVYAKFF